MAGSTWEFVQSLFLVFGGLGLFLYGMKMMSDGLENLAGDRMRIILEKATSNRFLGILLGAGVTAIIQSSSATTIMVVSFVNARLMTITQGLGVIMGANIGTTITAQIISFKIDTVAPILIFTGMIMYFIFRKRSMKNLGYLILGFGILFFGISVMGAPLKGFSQEAGFQAVLFAFENPLLALFAGLALTAVVQSSSAVTGIVVAMYLGGVDLSFHTAVFIVLGCNIGTCVTAFLASINGSRESKRAALTHILFNTIGCIVFGTIISIFPGILDWIQDTWAGGARQVAMFHTLFNVSTVIILVAFIPQLATLVRKILPVRPDENENTKRLLFLDQSVMQMPPIAVTQAQRELDRMGKMALKNLQDALDSFYTGDAIKAEAVLEAEETINFLNHQITAWLIRLRGLDISGADIEKLGMMLHTVSDIERIGDHAENIAEYALLEGQSSAKISPDAMTELKELGESTIEAVKLALQIFGTRDESLLDGVEPLEEKIDNLADECVENHIRRLKEEVCDPRGGVIYTDMVTDLERCADHATNIAYSILGETVWDATRHELRRV